MNSLWFCNIPIPKLILSLPLITGLILNPIRYNSSIRRGSAESAHISSLPFTNSFKASAISVVTIPLSYKCSKIYNSLPFCFHRDTIAVGSLLNPKSIPNAINSAVSGIHSTGVNSKMALSLLTYSPNPYTFHALGLVNLKSSIAFFTLYSK